MVTLSPSLLDPKSPEESDESGKLLKKLGEDEWRKARRMYMRVYVPYVPCG